MNSIKVRCASDDIMHGTNKITRWTTTMGPRYYIEKYDFNRVELKQEYN